MKRAVVGMVMLAVAGQRGAAQSESEPGADSPASVEQTEASVVAPPFAPWPTARLVLEVEVYSQGRLTRRDGDDLSEVRLDRGELGGRVLLGEHAAAELRMETIRSAADGGALGIDGDSTVMRLKLAQVVATHDVVAGVRLEGAFGVVPDPWIRGLEDDYTVKPLSRTGSERLLGWPVADLSGLARATFGPVRATVAVGNGEGQRFPERNTGKTTTAVLDVVPIRTPSLRLTASGVVRDGSLGVASIRDRRIGGALGAVTPWVRGGVEVVAARGIGDRGDAEGVLVGGWADMRVVEGVFVAARGQTLGFADDGGRLSSFGGGVAVEPWRERSSASDRARGRLRVWLAVDRVTASGGAMPLPGADPGDATLVMLVASATAPFAID